MTEKNYKPLFSTTSKSDRCGVISSYPLRALVFFAGWVSLILGCIGIFLPLLPTTPFILLSAYCFSRSSERLHQWLVTHQKMGLHIRDWQQNGSISKAAKTKATVLIIGTFAITFAVVNVALPVKGLIALIGVSVLTFIWTRPMPPTEQVLPAKIVVE